MKSLLLICILSLSIIGCEDPAKNALEGNTQPACPAGKMFGTCVDLMDWKIVLKTRAYPQTISLFINGSQVFTECSGDAGIGSIDRNNMFPVITLKQYQAIPSTATINLQLRNCVSLDSSFQNAVQTVQTPLGADNRKYVLVEI